MELVSHEVYGIRSPAPIITAGAFWIKASQLPDQFVTIFSDLERSNTAAIPVSGSYEASLFRNLFNDYYATSEYIIAAEESKETQAILPIIKQTMEVVGDDELNLSYDEWVYLVTGWYPKNNKSQRLASYARRASFIAPTLMTDGADADAPSEIYGKYGASIQWGFNKK